MVLPSDLVSQFVKVTKDDTKASSSPIVYGKAVVGDNGVVYVQLDGSELLTPVSTTTAVKDEDRVTVTIQDHTATITGNLSSPSARNEDVQANSSKINEFEIVIAHKVTADEITAIQGYIDNIIAITGNFQKLEAITGEFENLKAEIAEFDRLTANDIESVYAKIDSLVSDTIDTGVLDADKITAVEAEIGNLKAYTGEFTYITAVRASIKELNAEKLDVTWANIDYANIDEAILGKIYAKTGLIKDVTVQNGSITGHLVGVTISGDLIEGNTIMADKLVILGDDGVYYKLNYEGGALSGEGVAQVFYYSVTYDEETGEYVASTEQIDAIGDVEVNKTACYQVDYDETQDIYKTTTIVLDIDPTSGTKVDGVGTDDGRDVYSVIVDGTPVWYTIIPVSTVDGKEVLVGDADGTAIYYCKTIVYPDWASNSLHGSIIAAESITADKVRVTDLVAFGATIGGFVIGESSIHSLGKVSHDSAIPGIYMDNHGQVAFGDDDNFVRFYKVLDANGEEVKDTDGNCIYKLEISADSIYFGADSRTSASDLKALTEHVKIGTWTDPDASYYQVIRNETSGIYEVTDTVLNVNVTSASLVDGVTTADGHDVYEVGVDGETVLFIINDVPSIELAEGDSDFKQIITNRKTIFMNDGVVTTEVNNEGVKTDNVTVDNELRQGNFVWSVRANGNYGMTWKELTS